MCIRDRRQPDDKFGTLVTPRAATCPTKPAAMSELLLVDLAKSEAAIQESLRAKPKESVPQMITH